MPGLHGLPDTAFKVYTAFTDRRQPVIDKGREMARISIPSVFPPDGYQTGDNIPGPNQSFNALAVNNLTAKLTNLAFPPDRPVLQYKPIAHKLQDQIKQEPRLWTMIQNALSNLEIEHRDRLAATQIRSAYSNATKALLIGGNILWEHIELDTPVPHLPTRYIVKRNYLGEQLLVILERDIAVDDLSDEDRTWFDSVESDDSAKDEGSSGDRTSIPPQDPDQKPYSKIVKVYAVCKKAFDGNEPVWRYWEEYRGREVPGSYVEVDFDKPPLRAIWLIPVYGQNWGRGYMEEYQDDHYQVDAYEANLQDGSSLAALSLIFNKPGSTISSKQLTKAENLQVLTGDAEDISVFTSEKGRDMAFVNTQLEKVVRRLSRAYCMVSGLQRDGERVTAEEWIRLATEVQEGMGNIYTELSNSFQLGIIRRAVALHFEEDKNLQRPPEGLTRLAVLSGIDVLGRNIELRDLAEAGTIINQQFGPEASAKLIDPPEFTRRVFVGKGQRLEGLVKMPDEVAAAMEAEQEQAMRANMIDKATGPMAGAIAKTAGEAALAQMPQAAADQETPEEGTIVPPQPPTE